MINRAGIVNDNVVRRGNPGIVKMPVKLRRPGAPPLTLPPPKKPKPTAGSQKRPTEPPVLMAQSPSTKLASLPLTAGLLLALLLLIGALIGICLYTMPPCCPCFGASTKSRPSTLSKPFNPYKVISPSLRANLYFLYSNGRPTEIDDLKFLDLNNKNGLHSSTHE